MIKLFKAAGIIGLTLVMATGAMAADYIKVCKPCSREFIPVAEKVIADLNLEGQVEIKASSCLGQCGHGVIEFQGEVYSGMNKELLTEMLKNTYN